MGLGESDQAEQRNLNYLTETVESIWKVIKGAETFIQGLFPQIKTDKYSNLPEKLTFIHAEELLERYPDLPRKARGNSNPPGVSGGLYLWYWLGTQGRLPA